MAAVTCLVTGLALLGQPSRAEAGCGCKKAPPPPAAVRPHATYAGTEVSIFDATLQVGQAYDVTFTSGTTGASASVATRAVSRRDLADDVYKTQLNVDVPSLPLGPTSIGVRLAGQSGAILTIDDAALTVVPQPIPVKNHGESKDKEFRAAVSRDGVVYLSLDVSDIHDARIFRAEMKKYPLRFTSEDVLFYNTQGFLMQLLDGTIPGLFSLEATDKANDSDILEYARHEFNTHFLLHNERQAHTVDGSDPNWHGDGTPHIDHDHLIVAIAGNMQDGSLPVPGATPKHEFKIKSYTLFDQGLVGDVSVELTDSAQIDSYKGDKFEDKGDVFSNGTVSLNGKAVVNGEAIAAKVTLRGNGQVKTQKSYEEAKEFLAVDIPDFLEDLGSFEVKQGEAVILTTGSYLASEVRIEGTLFVDNVVGPVTIYVTGDVELRGKGKVTLAEWNPEKFAVYVHGPQRIRMEDRSMFYGVIYAPDSVISLAGYGEFFGSFVGAEVLVSEHARVHYDSSLETGEKTEGDLDKETQLMGIWWGRIAGRAELAAKKADDAAQRAAQAAERADQKADKAAKKIAKGKKVGAKKAAQRAVKKAKIAEKQAAKAAKFAAKAARLATRAASRALDSGLPLDQSIADRAAVAAAAATVSADMAGQSASDAAQAAADARAVITG